MQQAGSLGEELDNFDMPVKWLLTIIMATITRLLRTVRNWKCNVSRYSCLCKRYKRAAQRGHEGDSELDNRSGRGINKHRVIHTKPSINGR